jgi:hypothetical protein
MTYEQEKLFELLKENREKCIESLCGKANCSSCKEKCVYHFIDDLTLECLAIGKV